MNDFFSELNELIVDLDLDGSITPETIGQNRLRILRPISRIYPDSVTVLWFFDQYGDSHVLRLSYIHPLPLQHNLIGHFIRMRDYLFGRELSTNELELLSNESRSIASAYIPYIDFTDSFFVGQPSAGKIRKSQTYAPSSYNIGILTICGVERRYSIKESGVLLKLITTRLADVIAIGRLQRILTASLEIRKLSQLSLTEDQLISNTKSISQARIGSEAVQYFADFSAFVETSDRFKNIQFVRRSSLPYSWRLNKDDLGLLSIDQSPAVSSNNALLIPLMQKSFLLTKSVEFINLTSHNLRLRTTQECRSAILLLNKRSPGYLGDGFSATDIRIALEISEEASRALADIRAAFYRQKVNEFFESRRDLSDFDVTKWLKFIQPDIPRLRSVSHLTGADHKDSIVEWSHSEGNVPTSLEIIQQVVTANILKYYNRRVTKTNGFEHTTTSFADTFPSNVSLSISIAESQSLLLFHMPTKSSLGSYILFEISGTEITELEWNYIHGFINELHLVFMHSDTVRERVASMAQVRHAIIGPIAACERYLLTAVRTINREKRTEDGWKSIRLDSTIDEDLPHALLLAGQARVLTESAKYLTRRGNVDHVVSNQRLDLVSMIQEIKLSLQFSIDRKKLTWKFLTRLSRNQDQIYGRRDMIWICIYNIIENAVKYSSPVTTIEIDLRRKASDWVLTVTDVGTYIPPDQRRQIWGEFYRGRQSDLLNARSGTGLGLFVTRQILLAHSEAAKYACSSELIDGERVARTTFTLELPLRPGKEKG
jgi:Histidine kinase-, DNA gyrase B-, and HSP90-like ATPase